jgi:hypothetical protein
MDQDTPMNAGFGTTNASDNFAPGVRPDGVCATCGHNPNAQGLEQFLGKLGISDEMIRNLKSSIDSVEVEEYLNTAREYLRTGGSKAAAFAKENPGKVAAGVAVLAVGAGMLLNSLRE